MFCPNCTGNLLKNPKHAEGVWTCEYCTAVYFILVCDKPGKKSQVEPKDSADAVGYMEGEPSGWDDPTYTGGT